MRLALLMLALASCGPERPLHVMPAPDAYRPTQRFVVALNEAAGEPLVLIGSEPGATVWIYSACGTHYGNEISIAPCGEYEVDVMAVLLGHELGHALGLDHSPDPEALMYGRYHPMTVEDAAASLVAELR